MPDTQWYIGEEPTIIADAETSDYPEPTRGETTRFEFVFQGEADPGPTALGGTAGGTLGFTAGGTLGAQASASVSAGRGRDRYEQAREYLDYADAAVYGTDGQGRPYYRDKTPAAASVDSIVIPVRPGSGVQSGLGVWGIVVGGDDSTRIAGAQARLSMEVWVLAEYSEYGSRSEVSSALEATP